jgi:hypothetical protein
MCNRWIIVGVSLVAGVVLLVSPARATEVNCGLGETIAQALHGKGKGKSITVKGVCTEDVDIEKRDITLEGVGGEIVGTVTITGASRVVITNLTVRDAAGCGVVVTDASAVEIQGTTISNNDDGCGVSVSNASFLRIENSFILDHVGDNYALSIGSGSVVRGENNRIAGNTWGVGLFQHGTYIGAGEEIVEGSETAVEVARFSYFELRSNSSVTGDIAFSRQSHGSLRDTYVDGYISISNHSYVQARGDTDCDWASVGPTGEFHNSRINIGHNCPQ